MNNRIKKYLDNDLESLKPKKKTIPEAKRKCVVVCDSSNCLVTLSWQGEVVSWKWSDSPEGVIISEDIILPIHPLASEAFVVMEVGHFVSANDIDTDDVMFVDELGRLVDILSFHPKSLGGDENAYEKEKKCIIHLYLSYLGNNNMLTESMIVTAQENDVLEPFLTLVNV